MTSGAYSNENFLPEYDMPTAELYKNRRDKKLASLFQDAWYHAPDTPLLHKIPGWLLMCDLCSEEYMLFD